MRQLHPRMLWDLDFGWVVWRKELWFSSRLGVSGGIVTLQWRLLINPYPAGGETRVELRV